jgi:PII-like signaling protein
MTRHDSAQRPIVHIGEDDTYDYKRLHTGIVRRGHRAGLPGASVLRECEGLGPSVDVHVVAHRYLKAQTS